MGSQVAGKQPPLDNRHSEPPQLYHTVVVSAFPEVQNHPQCAYLSGKTLDMCSIESHSMYQRHGPSMKCRQRFGLAVTEELDRKVCASRYSSLQLCSTHPLLTCDSSRPDADDNKILGHSQTTGTYVPFVTSHAHLEFWPLRLFCRLEWRTRAPRSPSKPNPLGSFLAASPFSLMRLAHPTVRRGRDKLTPCDCWLHTRYPSGRHGRSSIMTS